MTSLTTAGSALLQALADGSLDQGSHPVRQVTTAADGVEGATTPEPADLARPEATGGGGVADMTSPRPLPYLGLTRVALTALARTNDRVRRSFTPGQHESDGHRPKEG